MMTITLDLRVNDISFHLLVEAISSCLLFTGDQSGERYLGKTQRVPEIFVEVSRKLFAIVPIELLSVDEPSKSSTHARPNISDANDFLVDVTVGECIGNITLAAAMLEFNREQLDYRLKRRTYIPGG